MAEHLKLRVEQFSMRAGAWQPSPAHLYVTDAATHQPWRTRGNLHILLEPAPGQEVPPSLYGELLSTLADTYYETSGSVTRGLRTAILAANALLYEHNMRLDEEQRVVVGINCVVYRGDEVFVGQLGPALVALLHRETLEQFPAESAWLRNDSLGALDLSREPPAGQRRDAEANLFHATFSPGETLVLASTSLARLTATPGLRAALSQPGYDTMRLRLEALAQGRDLSAVILDWAAPQAAERRPAPAVGLETATARGTSTPRVASAPPPVNASATATPQPVAAKERPVEDVSPPGVPPLALPRVDLTGLREGISRGAEQLRQGAEDLAQSLRTSESESTLAGEERPRRGGGGGAAWAGRILIVLVFLIPLAMLVVLTTTRAQYERRYRQQFSSLRATAQARYDTAVNLQDKSRIRQGLYEAMDAADEGLAIDPGDEILLELELRIKRKLNEIDLVEPLYHSWQLITLPDDDPTSSTDSSRIVVQGSNVYVLNRGSDRVYRFQLNNVGDALQPVDLTKDLILRKGETRKGIQVGDLVDAAWMGEGGSRTMGVFMALERGGSLLSYEPRLGVGVLPVANSDTWLKPQAMGCYQGNLYVLDPLINRLLKYTPTDNAYITPPSDYLNRQLDVDLIGAVDLAIDGNMYVLHADGRVSKFLKGEPLTFSMNGLPSPMRSPTTIIVSGAQRPDAPGYVYVTDTGNERIVQFDKAGNFIRQLRAKPGEPYLKNVRGIHVDEDKGRLIILSGRTLWLSELPRPKGR
jgi:hypothetical protein